MSEFKISVHAKARMQQRGIPKEVLPFLMAFGKREFDHRGGEVVFLTRGSRDKIRLSADKALFKRLEPALNVYAVLNVDGRIMTIGHRTRRINRH